MTATPCLPPRWSAVWKNWESSGRSRGHGSQPKTRTQDPCSGKWSTGLITHASHLPPKSRPANGSPISSTGTNTNTDTRNQIRDAPASSLQQAVGSAATALSSRHKPISGIPGDGPDKQGAGSARGGLHQSAAG